MVSDDAGRRLTVYIRRVPGRSARGWGDLEPTTVRLATSVVPARGLPSASQGTPDSFRAQALEVPYDQAQCLRLVVEIGGQQGYALRVVDVSDPAVVPAEVERAIGTGGSYPILVRPDGAWLEGAEYFTPSRLRKFLR